MPYKLRFSARAIADIDEFTGYLSEISETLADDYISELSDMLERYIAARPLTWSFFHLTGAPYRAYLFRVSRRSAYWVVYRVDEESQSVYVVRFWHASRAPASFELS